MKLQNLAIIFVVIILPISLILTSYTKTRIETINIQAQYDSKLNNATHDALKAYQINSFSSDASDLTNSKIRDIKASVNTFFNSMSSNFNSLGYTKSTLQNYVPALVYTMYDGYYIYSPYTNKMDKEAKEEVEKQKQENSDDPTFINGENLYGLKPYVYYSCRYLKRNENIDVVITYSLDNYIQIQGQINNKTVSKYGYLLNKAGNQNGDGVYVDYSNNKVYYKGMLIEEETNLKENVTVNNKIYNLPCMKKEGVKYYIDEDGSIVGKGQVFYVLNGTPINQSTISEQEIRINNNARKYYKDSYELMRFMEIYGLDDLKIANIEKIDNKDNYEYTKIGSGANEGKIFDFSNIESEQSSFNIHRMEVIKHSIERNLSIAISNFNNFSNVITDFQMPKLKETDWDKIMDNISIISFFQGANIGGKVYNGYSIITNTKNEDVVMKDSIYMRTKTKDIMHITDTNFSEDNVDIGIFNINTEIRTTNGTTPLYYMPITGTLSYDSLITKNKINNNGNIDKYIESLAPSSKIKNKYYTALGRERYSLYRQKLEI